MEQGVAPSAFIPFIPCTYFVSIHICWYLGWLYPSNSHYVYSTYGNKIDEAPFILRKMVLPVLCGPPNVQIWAELIVASFIFSALHFNVYRERWIGFLLMFVIGCAGAVISGFIFPAPFLGERTVWFVYFLGAKVFATVEILVEDRTLTIRPFWFLVPLIGFVHLCAALKPFVFMWFWAHLFFFLYFVVPRVVDIPALAPQWLTARL
jgi:uncharacterized membrane protein YeaQ/YmgE (transglycosylase-associated protein family)